MRVLVADRDEIVCRALSRLLDGLLDIEVVATSSDEFDVFVLASQLQPDIVVMDAQGFRFDASEWMELIRRTCVQAPAAGVIILGIYASFRIEALAAGACRFLLKDCTRNELAAAIRLSDQRQCQE